MGLLARESLDRLEHALVAMGRRAVARRLVVVGSHRVAARAHEDGQAGNVAGMGGQFPGDGNQGSANTKNYQ